MYLFISSLIIAISIKKQNNNSFINIFVINVIILYILFYIITLFPFGVDMSRDVNVSFKYGVVPFFILYSLFKLDSKKRYFKSILAITFLLYFLFIALELYYIYLDSYFN
jgi:hypothetical protein